jgi:O-Antigen ligase
LASAGQLFASRWRPDSIRLGPAAWAATAVTAIAVAWPVFVFTGSQGAYLITAAAAVGLAAWLAMHRSRLLLCLVLGELVLIGSEAGGHLGRGSLPLGSVRLLDITLLAGLGTLAAGALAAEAQRGPLREQLVIRVREANWRDLVRRAPAGAILSATVVWAALMWAVHGHHADGLLRTDLRVLGLGVATWVIASACRRPPPTELSAPLAILAVPVALKALAIWASSLYVIGANDRLQASLLTTPSDDRRVILLGGDTFLILAPALALLAVTRVRDWRVRALLVASALAAIGGLLISATRTGLVISVGLIFAIGLVTLVSRRRIIVSRASGALAVAALCIVAVGGLKTGLVERLDFSKDAPHSGINFRTDEIRSFLDLPAKDVLLGQGFAGRFATRNALDERTVSGWSHVLPVWIGLKVGLLGLAAACAALWLLIRRARRLLLLGGPPAREAVLGILIAGGMLAMSLTIDRAALPEGVPLLALGLALLPENPR